MYVVCLMYVTFFTMTSNSYISAENKDNDMKLSGCDPWDSRLDWTYSKLDLTVKHLLRIALRWGTVLRPGDYYTTFH